MMSWIWFAGQGLLMCDSEQDKDMWDIQNQKTCHVNTYKI